VEGGAPSPPGRRSPGSIAFLAAAVSIAILATAAPGRIQSPYPFLLRVEGFVGTKPEGIQSLARWTIAIDGAPYTLHVTKLLPLGAQVAYWTIINHLEPLPITLTLYGDPAVLRRFIDTAPGQRIAITGNFTAGPGPVTLQLGTIESLEAPDESAPGSSRRRPAVNS
jgi:hypothetical protein